ncbi:hypothetical protein FB390_0996 [Nocardia bhagyanarayanae]|uniref:Uncharacterized protein n=1 Tax=Nocardia bhagyanarayanae TaxID=1215925 RepID=A0A543F6D9_9NOCA|nr:hypothetical protein FB390_0996 [Nocardia bhagyanarayanae]
MFRFITSILFRLRLIGWNLIPVPIQDRISLICEALHLLRGQ